MDDPSKRGTGLRLAWFGHGPDRRGNGLITYSRETLRGLQEAGVEVVPAYHHRLGMAESGGMERLRALRIGSQDILSTPASHRRVEQVLRSTPVDAGHVSLAFSFTMDSWLPGLFHRLGKPIAATVHYGFGRRISYHTMVARLAYLVYLPIFHQYDALVVLGTSQKNLLIRHGLPGDRIHVIPNGVDVNRYVPGTSDIKRKFGAKWMAVYSGRVAPDKRVDVLVKIFSELNLPDSHKLVVMGEGTQRPGLQRRYGQDPRVVFTGYVADEVERINILRAADCFVLPSDVEGLSLALLEAMACGAAPVATNAGADGDLVDGVGIVLRSDQLESDLRTAILRMAGRPQVCRRMGDEARQRVVCRHNLQTQVGRLACLHRTLIAREA